MHTDVSKKTNNTSGNLKKRLRKNAGVYLIFLPTLLYYFIFKYLPMFGNVIAFQDYSIVRGFTGSEFVGLEHFKDFLSNYKFFELLRNTLAISGLHILIGFPAPIIFALLLNEVKNIRFKKSVQTITYMPHFISSVVMVSVLLNFLSSEGIINSIVEFFGGKKVPFMTTPKYFPWIYVLSSIWQSLGWSSIIYIAAIAGVDQELYEAAKIDGAGRFRQAISITLPCISPTIVVLLIMQVGSMLTVGYEKIILMYNPTIYETADVISTYVYRKGLLEMDYGYSTAVSIFNSICNLILLLSANAISKKVKGEGLW